MREVANIEAEDVDDDWEAESQPIMITGAICVQEPPENTSGKEIQSEHEAEMIRSWRAPKRRAFESVRDFFFRFHRQRCL